ncbi:hypothetical protein Gotur_017885 [Gossypium turneri]
MSYNKGLSVFSKVMDHTLLLDWHLKQKATNSKRGTRAFTADRSISILRLAVWIQLLGLPLEYFNEEVLVKVGKLVGRPIKLDSNTVYTTRGKFARICIEIYLSKPLIPSIRIEACVLKMVTKLEELSEAVQTKNTKATSEKTDKDNTLEMAEVEINNDRPKDLGRFNGIQVRHLVGKERQQQGFHATTHHLRTKLRLEETPMEVDVGQALVLQSTTLGVSTEIVVEHIGDPPNMSMTEVK